jgi:uncharacterized membrane protein YcgQ (UPF0703/DUF1980 family)
MVVYHGNIDTKAVFGQVKFKSTADTAAEQAIQPIGLPRDPSEPLPYLALLFELGNDSDHGAAKSKITTTTPTSATTFQELRKNWLTAVQALEDYQKRYPKKDRDPKLVEKQKQKVKKERLAMDAYNRYTIAVCGASSDVYGILVKAQVETEFANLLTITMPSPTIQDETIQRMWPLERLGGGHTAWMSKYVVGDLMDVDV